MTILLLLAWLIALPIFLVIAGVVLLLSSMGTALTALFPLILSLVVLFIAMGVIALPFKPLIMQYQNQLDSLVKWSAFLFIVPIFMVIGLVIIAFPLVMFFSIAPTDPLVIIFAVCYIGVLIGGIGSAIKQRVAQ